MEFFVFILELLGEFVLQTMVEISADLGITLFRKIKSGDFSDRAVISGFGYMFFGALAGGLSLLLFPGHLIQDSVLKILNLIYVPIILGLLMAAVGRRKSKKGVKPTSMDRFLNAYMFALSMAMIRYIFAY